MKWDQHKKLYLVLKHPSIDELLRAREAGLVEFFIV